MIEIFEKYIKENATGTADKEVEEEEDDDVGGEECQNFKMLDQCKIKFIHQTTSS